MKISQVLSKAADLIEKKGHCKNNYAKDKDGNSVTVKDKKAAMFCIEGAFCKVGNRANSCIVYDTSSWFIKYLGGNFMGNPIAAWNDDPKRTKKQVVVKLRKASIQAEKEGV